MRQVRVWVNLELEVSGVYFSYFVSSHISGDESELQDLIPISPPQVFDPESGQLTVRDESQMTPKQRKIFNKKLRSSPLVTEEKQASSDTDQGTQVAVSEKLDAEIVRAVPGKTLLLRTSITVVLSLMRVS